MTAPSLISRDPAVVEAALLELFSDALDTLLAAASSGSLTPRDAQTQTWSLLVPVGAAVLTALLATLARRASEADLVHRGLDPNDATMRLDREHWFTTTTTFGRVVVP